MAGGAKTSHIAAPHVIARLAAQHDSSSGRPTSAQFLMFAAFQASVASCVAGFGFLHQHLIAFMRID
jgi:hypothetical protein